MEIKYGTEVVDKRGKVVGTVGYVVRNTWTGEISKFMVRHKALGNELFFSAEDVLQVEGDKVKLRLSLNELSEK
jgi:sporulation protein YlmC with PRC-barrel domain